MKATSLILSLGVLLTPGFATAEDWEPALVPAGQTCASKNSALEAEVSRLSRKLYDSLKANGFTEFQSGTASAPKNVVQNAKMKCTEFLKPGTTDTLKFACEDVSPSALFERLKASGRPEYQSGTKAAPTIVVQDGKVKCTEYLKPGTTDTLRFDCVDLPAARPATASSEASGAVTAGR